MMKKDNTVLYAMSVVGSGCGFVTQMLVSGYWSTAYSHDVYHFSVNLAFYFLSLGLGSLAQGKIKPPATRHLFLVTIGLCLWTALSISLLRIGIALVGGMSFIPILVVSVAGFLAGTIVPLTLRLGEGRVTLSILFFLDYTAAIVFTQTFTHLCLIPLGYGYTALLMGGVCLLATTVFLSRPFSKQVVALFVVALLIPFPVRLFAYELGARFRDPKDTAKLIYAKQSHYQKIVITEEIGTGSFFPGIPQNVLYLDGMVQWGSIDEAAYHACIANIPEAAAESMGNDAKTALILGGGDGLVARNLLALRRIKKVTQVELDPEMIRLSLETPLMRRQNLDSLRSKRVDVVLDDAFHWLRHGTDLYDIIVIDFPHPRNVTLSRLFSAEFYSYVKRRLKPDGFVSVQSGPSINLEDPELMTLAKTPVSIRDTMRALGFNASLYVSVQDEEAFVLATMNPKFDMLAFAKKIGILGLQGMGLVCSYNPDWKTPEVKINTLNTLTVSRYMLDWYSKAGAGMFFNYRGTQSAFLPE